MALGSAAVLAVYFAGYYRTRAAAQRFDGEANGRRPTALPAVVAAAPAIVSQPVVPAPAPAIPAPTAVIVATPENPSPTAPRTTPTAIIANAPLSTALISPTPVVVASAPTPVAAPTPPPAAPTASSATATPVALVAEPASAAPAATTAATVQPKWKDGRFSGWGSCRHGDIEATIEIKDGRIISAIVSSCQTRYSCDVIAKIIPQVVSRQSADVDTVSGATQSADAFYWAVTGALNSAKPVPAKAS